MRIASLVPSATEMLFALGLGDRVVAVTHECDYPAAAAALPHVTRSVIPGGLTAADIDQAVRSRVARGEALYELDVSRLTEAAPDLVVTQAVCEVCAVSYDDVVAVTARLPTRPRVVSLDPANLDDVLGDVTRLADVAGVPEAGVALVGDARRRLERVRQAVAGVERPRVVALEWLAPPMVGGHWVPEMVRLAGGNDVLGQPGARSRTVSWDEVTAARPEVVIVMPCGYDAGAARREAEAHSPTLGTLHASAVHAVDASGYFSRPGPRLVAGVELLARLFHPSRAPALSQAMAGAASAVPAASPASPA